MNIINKNNWQYSSYESLGRRIFISYGASIDLTELYSVTITNLDYTHESFQKDFNSLDEAIIHINKHYSHLKFTEKVAEASGGCSSCG